jgi:hypothetical protein
MPAPQLAYLSGIVTPDLVPHAAATLGERPVAGTSCP